jgi:mevalonate kinase
LVFNSYYNAKLLLSAEYLVLNGAKALAVPLQFGQQLVVDENRQGFISWHSIAHDASTWFTGSYSLKDFSIIESSNADIAKYPQRLLQASRKQNPEFCMATEGVQVVSTLNYPLLWGLGSSSTLIAGIAAWAKIDPFSLHFEVSAGSGYDIACAISNKPIIYALRNSKPEFETVQFSPKFADKIFFVYQGNKQDSAEGIKQYRLRKPYTGPEIINAATALTNRMLSADSLSEFEDVMQEHERLISNLLQVPSVQNSLFHNLPGQAKSLGAWGGDFSMITWNDDPLLLPLYLKSKGLEIWFNYNEIVL